MFTLRRYTDPNAAHTAAEHLRENGVPAAVVGEHLNPALVGFVTTDVVILSESHRSEAERLLALLEGQAAAGLSAAEAEELDRAAAPDLSSIDVSKYPVSCRECGYSLDGLAHTGECPECSHPFDRAALIITKYGPEAFETAAPDAESE